MSSEHEIRIVQAVPCQGVAEGIIFPLPTPRGATVTQNPDGTRAVGCDALNDVTGMCRAAEFRGDFTLQLPCTHLRPVTLVDMSSKGIALPDTSTVNAAETTPNILERKTPTATVMINSDERLVIVTHNDGTEKIIKDIPNKEFALLTYLSINQGRVCSRAQILDAVWGSSQNDVNNNKTVETHIKRVRDKLGGERDAILVTVRGLGYRMRGANERYTSKRK